jgi:glycosyltransferase involved in cell wall biosynthesis
MSPQASRRPVIAFFWHHFSQYHMDRCRALGQALAGQATVVGLEVGSTSVNYAWGESGAGTDFTKVTLFPGAVADTIGSLPRMRAILRATREHGITHLFLSGYERPYCFAIAILFRLMGKRVYVPLDSKFDDKPRRLSQELLKRVLMLPYNGGFAAGRRSKEYLRFLGLRRRPVTTGYDTVSIDRLRALVSEAPPAWEQRPFLVVSRFIPKKNLSTALRAYALYKERAGANLRRLRLCGGGQLEGALRAEAEALGITGEVDFLGFEPQDVVALEMARALCLLLPSREEQWGLVVNEALAFDLPILASTTVGALDTLVTPLGNGVALDCDDVGAWADAMLLLASDRALWERLSAGSRRHAPLGDVAAFVDGVTELVGLRPAAAG